MVTVDAGNLVNRAHCPVMDQVRIGGISVARNHAVDHARRDLTDGTGWAYPSYDGYEHDRAAGPLSDADLLAPVLLNVAHLKIQTFEALKVKRTELNESPWVGWRL